MDNIKIHKKAIRFARQERMYGDQTDLIKGWEEGFKAGLAEAKEDYEG